MTILVNKPNSTQLDIFNSLQDFKKAKSEFISNLSNTPIKLAINEWLKNLSPGTRRNYSYYINGLMKKGLIPDATVGIFNEIPHEINIDDIKRVKEWSEGTRQCRASCYISFTAYLHRISYGWFRRAVPSNLAANRTFFQIRDKCATEALSLHEWHKFIEALEKINLRDSLIAKCLLQGAKRISEVLDAREDCIDFDKGIIRFKQGKARGAVRWMFISFPNTFLNALKDYLYLTHNQRTNSGLIFITNQGKKVFRTRLNFSFKKASDIAGIKRVTPHVLRATWVTLAKTQGVPDSEIMKVTGHKSSNMIYAYDKSYQQNNYTKKMVLI